MNSRMHRVFFGLPLVQESHHQLTEVMSELYFACTARSIRARWVAPENLHCTLKFLGPLTPEMVARAVDEAARLTSLKGLTAEWRGLGAFPSARRSRVVVAHLRDSEQILTRLARDFDALGACLGVPSEQRAYQPHITLARLERPRDCSDVFDLLTLRGSAQLGPVTLYESHLQPGGSHYEPLWTSHPEPSPG
jgi:RNA 2',3'-cyclic 3'-phosphodiesterase